MKFTRMAQPKVALIVGLLSLVLIGGGIVGWNTLAEAGGVPLKAPITTTGVPDTSGTSGSIGDTLRTPSGLAITLVKIEKGKTRWLIHFKVANTSTNSLAVRDRDMVTPAGTHADQGALNHQFVLATMPALHHVESRPLSLPTAAESAMHHGMPAAFTLRGNGTADGWLAVDVSDLDQTHLTQVVYDFDPVSSMACANPSDKSTCTPETLYHVLIWNIA